MCLFSGTVNSLGHLGFGIRGRVPIVSLESRSTLTLPLLSHIPTSGQFRLGWQGFMRIVQKSKRMEHYSCLSTAGMLVTWRKTATDATPVQYCKAPALQHHRICNQILSNDYRIRIEYC